MDDCVPNLLRVSDCLIATGNDKRVAANMMNAIVKLKTIPTKLILSPSFHPTIFIVAENVPIASTKLMSKMRGELALIFERFLIEY